MRAAWRMRFLSAARRRCSPWQMPSTQLTPTCSPWHQASRTMNRVLWLPQDKLTLAAREEFSTAAATFAETTTMEFGSTPVARLWNPQDREPAEELGHIRKCFGTYEHLAVCHGRQQLDAGSTADRWVR
jgi:hypothetical protein